MAKLEIWKFPCKLSGEFEVEIPSEFRVINVQAQDDKPYFWAIVNPEAKKVPRIFISRQTGEPFTGDLKYAETDPTPQYLGTFHVMDSNFVGHLFLKKVRPA